MKFSVARPTLRNLQPRFFTGRYQSGETGLECLSPVTTGDPADAHTYEDRVVAELIAAFLNVLVGIKTGENTKPWIIIELPEAWTS